MLFFRFTLKILQILKSTHSLISLLWTKQLGSLNHCFNNYPCIFCIIKWKRKTMWVALSKIDQFEWKLDFGDSFGKFPMLLRRIKLSSFLLIWFWSNKVVMCVQSFKTVAIFYVLWVGSNFADNLSIVLQVNCNLAMLTKIPVEKMDRILVMAL